MGRTERRRFKREQFENFLKNLKSEDDEDDLAEEEEQKGFIVDDDYLSVSEMNYSNISSKDQNEIMADLARKKAIIQKNRESKEVLAKNNEL